MNDPSNHQLVMLLHLCDSLFPSGGFAHSDGLEAATAAGRVTSARDLSEWIEVYLDEPIERVDGPAMLMARAACVNESRLELEALDAHLYALRPSATGRSAIRATGSRLLKTWFTVHGEYVQPSSRLACLRTPPAYTLPVAFGIVCALAGVAGRAGLEGFIYSRLAASISSAMRLMPIGQNEAHGVLACALRRVPAAADAIARHVAGRQRIGAFAPAMDLASMEQRSVRSRLFLS
jgi:urease accessory protein